MYKQFIVVTEAVEHCKSTLLISVNPMPYSLMLDSASNRIVPGPFWPVIYRETGGEGPGVVS